MDSKPYSWVALDRSDRHPTVASERNACSDDSIVETEAEQLSKIAQLSSEVIVIKDSCDIDVQTTETQVAVSLQVAIQVAIALVINITIADSARAEQISTELLQASAIKQSNRQKLVIENSRDVHVTTTDTDVALSIQLLVQILVALVVSLDIL
ncbi:spore coat protein [Bacillus gobiensis]|uniref:spore coat protein n=1 Tax=Bacillus gobiensis TaxID=1441095 RepID=UPI003D19BCFE